jgi:hypothetical protein
MQVMVRWATSYGDPGEVIDWPATPQACTLLRRRGLVPLDPDRVLWPCTTCGADFIDARTRNQHRGQRHGEG